MRTCLRISEQRVACLKPFPDGAIVHKALIATTIPTIIRASQVIDS
jgi:hypothetical protein